MAHSSPRWLFTTKQWGDFAIDGDAAHLSEIRRKVAAGQWVWLRQVHGNTVRVVTRGNADSVRGSDGDGLVTTDVDMVLAVQTADCAPVLFTGERAPGESTVIGAAHAGWRGLVAGVVQETVKAMTELGAVDIAARLGPCICVDHYEFGEPELSEVASMYGPAVRGRTSAGLPALDLRLAVTGACLDSGLAATAIDTASNRCTAHSGDLYFSHRARSESGRMASLIWNQPS